MEKPPENPLKAYDFRAVLSWYHEMGVDATIGEHPINWLNAEQCIDQSLIARARKKAKPKRDQSPAAAFLHKKTPAANMAT